MTEPVRMTPGKQRVPTPEELALVHMDPLSRRFVLAGLGYLALGNLLALVPLLLPELPLSPWFWKAHIHLFTLGFFSFTIYGLGCHMLPRFVGRAPRWGWRAPLQETFAHVGLWLMLGGWLLGNLDMALAGGILSFSAMLLFTSLMQELFRKVA